jgi:hypothetical protein
MHIARRSTPGASLCAERVVVEATIGGRVDSSSRGCAQMWICRAPSAVHSASLRAERVVVEATVGGRAHSSSRGCAEMWIRRAAAAFTGHGASRSG